jgi:hypothetical protein
VSYIMFTAFSLGNRIVRAEGSSFRSIQIVM